MTRNYEKWQVLILGGLDFVLLLILAYLVYFAWAIIQIRLYGLPSFDASSILYCLGRI